MHYELSFTNDKLYKYSRVLLRHYLYFSRVYSFTKVPSRKPHSKRHDINSIQKQNILNKMFGCNITVFFTLNKLSSLVFNLKKNNH